MSAESSRDTWQYARLLADGMRHGANQDYRKAAKACAEAIALKPDKPTAYYNLGSALHNSGHYVEAAQRFLDASERVSVGSVGWAQATARAFDMLQLEDCAKVAKPEWWNDEGLKALSGRVLRAAPNDQVANLMRAEVLYASRGCRSWDAGPRSAAELEEAAAYFDRSAALTDAPALKAALAAAADECHSKAALGL